MRQHISSQIALGMENDAPTRANDPVPEWGHEHTSRMSGRHGASASVTGHDRRSAANW